jgi:hypothetical protein
MYTIQQRLGTAPTQLASRWRDAHDTAAINAAIDEGIQVHLLVLISVILKYGTIRVCDVASS